MVWQRAAEVWHSMGGGVVSQSKDNERVNVMAVRQHLWARDVPQHRPVRVVVR